MTRAASHRPGPRSDCLRSDRQSWTIYLPDTTRTAPKTAQANRPATSSHALAKGGALVLFTQLKGNSTRRVNQPLERERKERRRTFKLFHLHSYKEKSSWARNMGRAYPWDVWSHCPTRLDPLRRSWVLIREESLLLMSTYSHLCLVTTDIQRNVQSLHPTNQSQSQILCIHTCRITSAAREIIVTTATSSLDCEKQR